MATNTFQIYVVRTVPKFNLTIVKIEAISIPTNIYMSAKFSCVSTDTSMKSGGV